MRVGDKQGIDEVIFFHRRGLLAASAALLRAIIGNRLILDIAGVRHRHDHLFGGDQIFHRHFLTVNDDLGTALVAKLLLHLIEFSRDNRRYTLGFIENIEEVADLFHDLFVLGNNLVLLQSRQALQA